jgi:hypothetical protein
VATAPIHGSSVSQHAQATAAQASAQARELAGEQLIDSAKHGDWSLSWKLRERAADSLARAGRAGLLRVFRIRSEQVAKRGPALD